MLPATYGRNQRILAVAVGHRQLPRHSFALSREAHRLVAIVVVGLDEACLAQLLGERVQLGVAVGQWTDRRGRPGRL